ncbi:MAG: hypothetical protein WBE34_00375 [Candidatus Nitrosopolaris sp.]
MKYSINKNTTKNFRQAYTSIYEHILEAVEVVRSYAQDLKVTGTATREVRLSLKIQEQNHL